jgi:transposase
MSIQPRQPNEIPEETRRVAHLAFPKGNLYMRMREELGPLYTDERFTDLFAVRGQPAESPGRLALVTIMQFAEGLSDRQAADAVRARIDWKYALGLELTDAGFDFSVLSEFRDRLIARQRERLLLDTLLDTLKQKQLLKARGRQRTDSTHVLAAIRELNRLEVVGETLRRALNELAEAAPDWLRTIAKPEWFPRYAQRFDSIRLPKDPATRQELIETIGVDGIVLLNAVRLATHSESLRELPGVEILRQVWLQQYYTEIDEDGTIHSRLRTNEEQPPGELRIHSPYDPEARYSAKRTTEWVGYKAFVTETCDDDGVHLITHVDATSAVTQDVDMGEPIHAALAAKDLLPDEHLMDAGFLDAEFLVMAQQEYQVEIVGPVKRDVRWQANAGKGFGLSEFKVDWETQTVLCPRGQMSSSWSEQRNAAHKHIIQVKFKPSICRACPAQADCTHSKRGIRTLVLQPQAHHEALQQVRRTQETPEFRKRYAKRSGIEGTISQGTRAFDLRRSRYIGLVKTRLQMIATATAINLHRLFDWWTGVPRAVTRISSFARLAPEPALLLTTWRVT